jgi:uncharacterized membrane protein YccC
MTRLILSILLSLTFILLLARLASNTSPRLFNIFIGILIGITVSYLAPQSLFNRIDNALRKFKNRILRQR